MFSTGILRSFLTGVRSCRCKSSGRISNPGVQRRIKLFKDNNPDIDKLELSENDLDFYETDFAKADKFYENYLSESKKLKRNIEFKRIERKYFGGRKEPNLLTWAEKEQIRYLHNSDPATWTYEKLALSFPATVDVIKRVIKSQWKPSNPDRIKRHDAKVSANWKAIENGEIVLSPPLMEHIQTFVARKGTRGFESLPVEETSLTTRLDDPSSSSSEFLNIIKSYKQRKDPDKYSGSPSGGQEEKLGSVPDYPSETYVLEEKEPTKLKHKYYTLDALRKEITSGKESGKELSPVDEHFLRGTIPKPSASIASVRRKIQVSPEFDKFGTHKRIETGKVLEHDDIPEKIHIPKDKRKPGSLYKVKDCYYNDEGEFLYRVPGMS